MRFKVRPLTNVFSDKSSLVIRALLRDPSRHWTIPELAAEGISEAQVINVLDLLEEGRWIHRHRAWRDHYVQLVRPKELLAEWGRTYRFDWNPSATYFSSNSQILSEIAAFLKAGNIPFALTMLSGARLVAPYVVRNVEHIYLLTDPKQGEDVLSRFERQLHFPSPGRAGNVHFAIPYYRAAIFKGLQEIKGLPVVSNLQLYLDLLNEPGTGADQADWLWTQLKERGTPIIPIPAKAGDIRKTRAA